MLAGVIKMQEKVPLEGDDGYEVLGAINFKLL